MKPTPSTLRWTMAGQRLAVGARLRLSWLWWHARHPRYCLCCTWRSHDHPHCEHLRCPGWGGYVVARPQDGDRLGRQR